MQVHVLLNNLVYHQFTGVPEVLRQVEEHSIPGNILNVRLGEFKFYTDKSGNNHVLVR